MPIFGPQKHAERHQPLDAPLYVLPLHVQLSGNLRLIRGNQVLVVELFQERHQHPEILKFFTCFSTAAASCAIANHLLPNPF